MSSFYNFLLVVFLTFFDWIVQHCLCIHVFGIGVIGMYEVLFNCANFFLPMRLVICKSCFLLVGVNSRKPKGGSQKYLF
jgi:hypothetical protein